MKLNLKPILSAVAVVAVVACVSIVLAAMIAYPMHLGEPSWYHTARVDCLKAAIVCVINFVAVLILCR